MALNPDLRIGIEGHRSPTRLRVGPNAEPFVGEWSLQNPRPDERNSTSRLGPRWGSSLFAMGACGRGPRRATKTGH